MRKGKLEKPKWSGWAKLKILPDMLYGTWEGNDITATTYVPESIFNHPINELRQLLAHYKSDCLSNYYERLERKNNVPNPR